LCRSLLIATSGPLVQRWFSWTDHRRAEDPYFLYAAGNIGSFGGLLAYPFLIEPRLSIDDQARLWAAGYAMAVVLERAAAGARALDGSAIVDLVRSKPVAADPDAVEAIDRQLETGDSRPESLNFNTLAESRLRQPPP
jgi:hypothetical protein